MKRSEETGYGKVDFRRWEEKELKTITN